MPSFVLIFFLFRFLLAAMVASADSENARDFMSQILKIRTELNETKTISKEKYLDTLQISYARNRQPNVVSYGITLPLFSQQNVSELADNSSTVAVIPNDTSIIEIEVFTIRCH